MKKRCVICKKKMEPQKLFRINGYDIMTCACKLYNYTNISAGIEHVKNVYGDDYFKGGGAGYPEYISEENLLVAHGRRYANILKKYMQSGSVLDIGSAAGFILQGMVEAGWQGEGVEPNAAIADYAKKKYKLNIHTVPLELFESEKQFNLILMIQVIAHFYDLESAIGQALKHLKPGGFLLVETWNKNSLTAKMFGKNWHEYSPPSVLHYFTPDSLNLLMDYYSMISVEKGKPSKWINGSHVKSLLDYKLRHIKGWKKLLPFLKLIPESLALPYPAEDLFWALYQKKE